MTISQPTPPADDDTTHPLTIEKALARELIALESAETGGSPWFRLWTTRQPAVVVGRAVVVAAEVDEDYCTAADIAVVRRMSGGRSVFVGPGTLQYGLVLPYALSARLETIAGSKRFCNEIVIASLTQVRASDAARIEEDVSGDWVSLGRKVAGIALRRRRAAMLIHGTILLDADLGTIARALRHPLREPAYRAGRDHESFLANIGIFDVQAFEDAVRRRLAELA